MTALLSEAPFDLCVIACVGQRAAKVAERAALLCGIPRGSAVEREELSALGMKLDKLTEGVGIAINQNYQQQQSIDEVKELVSAKNASLRGKALTRQEPRGKSRRVSSKA